MGTFNKKIRDGIEGHAVVNEKDELPPMEFDNTIHGRRRGRPNSTIFIFWPFFLPLSETQDPDQSWK